MEAGQGLGWFLLVVFLVYLGFSLLVVFSISH